MIQLTFQLGFLRQFAQLLFIFCPKPLPEAQLSSAPGLSFPLRKHSVPAPHFSGPIGTLGPSQMGSPEI